LKLNNILICNIISYVNFNFLDGDWGLGIGDWGFGGGAQTPKPQTHNPTPPNPKKKIFFF